MKNYINKIINSLSKINRSHYFKNKDVKEIFHKAQFYRELSIKNIFLFLFFIFIFSSFSFFVNTNITFAADTIPPTVALTSAASSTVNASFSVTATFSEPVFNFVLGDITVTNGTVSNFSGSGTTYTFTVTPTLNGLVSVDILAGVATDAAGNGNSTTVAPTYALRSTGPGGGLVFYTTNGGLQGLEAAPTDQSTGIAWITGGATQYTTNYNTGTAVGTGQSNTNAMIAQAGYTGGAAKVVDDLVSGGQSDWFLPSKDELNLMRAELYSFGLGSFSNIYTYWSSSEATGNTAWYQTFSGGDQNYYGKNYASFYVRAVRSFAFVPATLTRTYADITPPTVSITSATASTVNAPFSVTATFSEPVFNFVLGDITVTNGTASNFSGSGTTYTFTVTPTANGLVSVDILAGVAADAAGNGNIATTVTPPTQSIGNSYGGGIVAYILQAGDPGYDALYQKGLIAATADQSSGIIWAVSAYQDTDVPSGATATAIGTGLVNTNAIVSQNSAGSTYAAGLARAYNGGGYTDWYLPSKDELTQLFINRVAIGGFASNGFWSSSEYDYADAWLQNFGNGSSNGYSKSAMPHVRAVRSFASTPETLIRTYDATPPSVSLTSSAASTVGAPFTVTATFSESVAGFVLGDITVTNGTASSFSGSGTTYTFTITPTVDGLVSVNIAAGVATDAAGNGNIIATSLTRVYDHTGPTVSLTSAVASTVGAPFSVTATFSESVSNFVLGDITVTNGTTSSFSGSGTTYTFTVTPTANGLVSVDILAGVATDAVGNGNTTTTAPTYALRSIGPGDGLVFYTAPDGLSGLEAAPVSTEWYGKQWGCYGSTISGADGTALGTGAQNTIDIVNGCAEADRAARLASDLVSGGQSDWFLPSKDELGLIYTNLKLYNVGGFASDYYWSSSEYSANEAWTQYYTSINGGHRIKYGTGYVRAVRGFTSDGSTLTRTYIPPTITQSNYKLFSNINNTDVGGALTAQNTSYTLSNSGDAFRLRLLMGVGGSTLPSSGANLKLQYAQKVGQCDTSFVGESYTDVTNQTGIAYYKNFNAENGSQITLNANDPTHSTDTIIAQSYVDSSIFTNTISSIPVGQYGMWDFSLYNKGISSNTSYCLRVVNSDNSLLYSYSFIPEITTAVRVSRGGGSVLNIEAVTTPNAPVSSGSGNGGGGSIILPQCSDGLDNNGNSLVDTLEPNCHINGNINNEYVPLHNSEAIPPVVNAGGGQGGSGNGDLGYLFFKKFSFLDSLLARVFKLS